MRATPPWISAPIACPSARSKTGLTQHSLRNHTASETVFFYFLIVVGVIRLRPCAADNGTWSRWDAPSYNGTKEGRCPPPAMGWGRRPLASPGIAPSADGALGRWGSSRRARRGCFAGCGQRVFRPVRGAGVSPAATGDQRLCLWTPRFFEKNRVKLLFLGAMRIIRTGDTFCKFRQRRPGLRRGWRGNPPPFYTCTPR